MRLAGARGGGGVEVADVVAGLVGPQLRELGAAADAGRAAVAGQAVRDEPHERHVDRVEQGPRDRSRSLAALRRLQADCGHQACANRVRRPASGSATATSSRSITASVVRPSLSA